MKLIIKFLFSVFMLPVVLTIDTFKSENSVGKKLLLFILVWLLIGITWVRGYTNLYATTTYLLYDTGLTDKISNITVIGTSMLPGIQDGEKITLHNPKKYRIARGDVVSFSNVETSGQFYIKRVVGLPGDELVVKNGQVFVNKQALKEDYIHNNAPTYGNTFLLDCQPYVVPKGKLAVFGDNRIASTDSRVIGFIDMADIEGVIKKNVATTFEAAHTSPAISANFDVQAFIDGVNKKRKEKNVAPLQLNNTLSTVALDRAKIIAKGLKDEKETNNQLTDLLQKANYDYLLVQEVNTMGNYTPDQLTQHVLELQPYNLDFVSSSYYEIGIGTSTANNNQCQIPVIDIVLGWPTKPNTPQAVIDSWQAESAHLSTLIGHLNELKTIPEINVEDTQNIIGEVSGLLEEANRYKSLALENRWLTGNEVKLADAYDNKMKEVQKKVADYVRKYAQYITNPEQSKFFADYKWGNGEFVTESNKAKELFSQGKYNEVLDSAQKLITMASNGDEKAIGYYWQGQGYLNLNRLSEAKASLLSSVENDPTYAAPNATLAAVSFQEQNFTEGLRYAQKCEQLDTTYPWCHNNLAIAYISLGQKDKALAEIKIAISQDPSSYVFNDNLRRMQAAP